MNIEQLSNLNANVCVSVTLSDLREFLSSLVAEAETTREQVENEEIMLTAEETAKALCISENSLWRWGKLGYIKGVKVGRKVLYRKSDVDSILIGNKS